MRTTENYLSVPQRQLWFSLAVGPVLWSIHLVVNYALVSLYCQWRFLSFTVAGIPGIIPILTLVTLVAAALVLYGGYLAYRNWRRMENEDRLEGQTEQRQYFLAQSGILMSSLFSLVILLSLIPTFVISPCAGP